MIPSVHRRDHFIITEPPKGRALSAPSSDLRRLTGFDIKIDVLGYVSGLFGMKRFTAVKDVIKHLISVKQLHYLLSGQILVIFILLYAVGQKIPFITHLYSYAGMASGSLARSKIP